MSSSKLTTEFRLQLAPKRRHGTLRRLHLAIPLTATLFLSACAGSGLEMADLSAASMPDNASGATSSAPIETASLPPLSSNTPAADTAPLSPAIAKARSLRANGDLQGAWGVLDQAAQNDPKDKDLTRERGLLALEMGKIKEAKTLLSKADDPKSPDWRIKSALGSAHAAAGDQPAAQREFAAALKIAPDHPSILNNLALSYALSGRHQEAEQLLRRAARSKHVEGKAKQNLALLLGLNGDLDQARQVSEGSLPRDLARSNISYLERLKSDVRISRANRSGSGDTTSAATMGALTRDN